MKLENIVFSAKGYKVTGTMAGRMALEDINTEKPDLVLLDRRIKENPETGAIPVVMLTTSKNSQDQARWLEAGADAYITKPFKSAQVIETIESLLNRE